MSTVRLVLDQEVGTTVPFRQWLRSLSLRDFCLLYGHMWEPELGAFDRWKLWTGVRGYPGQPEMLDALETAEILWLLKTRQIAGTTAAALLMVKIGLTEENALQLVFSKDMVASKAVLAEKVKTHLDALTLLRAPDGGSLPWPKWGIGKEVIEFEFGNSIQAMASTASGAISRVPRYQLWDEVREYEGETAPEMYASNLPVLNKNAQLAIISTNKPGTWYSKMSQLAVADWRRLTGARDGRGAGAVRLEVMPKVTFMFIPYDVRVGRDSDWYRDMRATYQDDTKFKREFPTEPEDVFLTREGLVFPSFKERNTVMPAHFVGGMRWHSEDEFWLVYDHGRSREHPALCWFAHYRPSLDHVHVFDEVFADEDPELPEVARRIQEKLEHWYQEGCNSLTRAIGDVTGKEFSRRQQMTRSIAECLEEEMGVHWEPAQKQDKEGSLELARARVFHGRFTIDPRACPNSVRMLQEHKFKEGTDMPSEKMDESADLLRYLSHELVGRALEVAKTPLESMLERARRREEKRMAAGLNAGLGEWLGGRDTWGVFNV